MMKLSIETFMLHITEQKIIKNYFTQTQPVSVSEGILFSSEILNLMSFSPL